MLSILDRNVIKLVRMAALKDNVPGSRAVEWAIKERLSRRNKGE